MADLLHGAGVNATLGESAGCRWGQPAFREVEETNVPILRRIWIRFQGASMGALLYAPIDATRKTDSKTSKMGAFVSSTSLKIGAIPE
jgi:hypothetical protein